MADRDLQFGRVLESGSSEKRALLIVLPVVVLLAIVVGFALVAISRMSGLSTEVQVAKRQAEEAQKAADERDQKLREARAEAGILGSAGQGAAVLVAASADSGASGIAIAHPEANALSVYAYNLTPPPEGQDYRVIVRDASGQEKDAAGLTLDDRGGAFVLVRNVPDGATHVEVAIAPKGAQGQGVPEQKAKGEQAGDHGATRQPVLAADLPLPGEAGVVAAAAPEKPQGRGGVAQGRRGRR